jgi:phosphoribosyl-AMP cyclohydrolase/phosphoribosyl-ATP pyrophosphohydrolase/phosphoribosyl-AMP cyclohydrolase
VAHDAVDYDAVAYDAVAYDVRMPVAISIVADAEQLAAVTYNADGLVPAIVQEHGTGEVLMMAWMNEETLRETLESGRTVFWSRSRQQRWRKGDSSGERQWVKAAYYDCDGDTLLFVVEQEGAGACHTGEHSCFYRRFGPEPAVPGLPLTGATTDGGHH